MSYESTVGRGLGQLHLTTGADVVKTVPVLSVGVQEVAGVTAVPAAYRERIKNFAARLHQRYPDPYAFVGASRDWSQVPQELWNQFLIGAGRAKALAAQVQVNVPVNSYRNTILQQWRSVDQLGSSAWDQSVTPAVKALHVPQGIKDWVDGKKQITFADWARDAALLPSSPTITTEVEDVIRDVGKTATDAAVTIRDMFRTGLKTATGAQVRPALSPVTLTPVLIPETQQLAPGYEPSWFERHRTTLIGATGLGIGALGIYVIWRLFFRKKARR